MDDVRNERKRMAVYKKIASRTSPAAVEIASEGLAIWIVDDIKSPSKSLQKAAIDAAIDFATASTEETNAASIIEAICSTILTTVDETVCTGALRCLSKQSIVPHCIECQISLILGSVEQGMTGFSSAGQVVFYALKTLLKLLDQVPIEMEKCVVRWNQLVYPYLLAKDANISKLALEIFRRSLPFKVDKLLETFVPDLKQVLLPEMKKAFTVRAKYVLQVWGNCIALLGSLTHEGSLINDLLKIVEMGFRSTDSGVCAAAYRAWSHLIRAFALSPAVIGNVKHLNLLMAPLEKDIYRKSEETLDAKIEAWRLLVKSLAPNQNQHFKKVFLGFLNFCFGSSVPTSRDGGDEEEESPSLLNPRQSNATRRVEKLASTTKKSSETLPFYAKRISAGVDVFTTTIAKLDNNDETLAEFLAIIAWLHEENRVSTDRFIGAWKAFFSALVVRPSFEVVDVVFAALAAWKSMSCDAATSRLIVIGNLAALPWESFVEISVSYRSFCSKTFLTPIRLLVKLLLLEVSDVDADGLLSVYSRLVNVGTIGVEALGFVDFVLDQINVVDSDLDAKLWIIVVEQLLTYFDAGRDVNEGTLFKPDFSTCFKAILLPFELGLFAERDVDTRAAFVRVWSSIWRAFVAAAPAGGDSLIDQVLSRRLMSTARSVATLCALAPTIIENARRLEREVVLDFLTRLIDTVATRQIDDDCLANVRSTLVHFFGRVRVTNGEHVSKLFSTLNGTFTHVVSSSDSFWEALRSFARRNGSQGVALLEPLVETAARHPEKDVVSKARYFQKLFPNKSQGNDPHNGFLPRRQQQQQSIVKVTLQEPNKVPRARRKLSLPDEVSPPKRKNTEVDGEGALPEVGDLQDTLNSAVISSPRTVNTRQPAERPPLRRRRPSNHRYSYLLSSPRQQSLLLSPTKVSPSPPSTPKSRESPPGILKKGHSTKTFPSPPSGRRVTFAIPQSPLKELKELGDRKTVHEVATENEEDLKLPVFPLLIDCRVPIDEILPSLFPSGSFRGLAQLIRSRGISTIGDLCKCSKADVRRLPIKQPKIETVLKELKSFQTKLEKLPRPSFNLFEENVSSPEMSPEFPRNRGPKTIPSKRDSLAVTPAQAIRQLMTSIDATSLHNLRAIPTDDVASMVRDLQFVTNVLLNLKQS